MEPINKYRNQDRMICRMSVSEIWVVVEERVARAEI
jgi:hypothetical protein